MTTARTGGSELYTENTPHYGEFLVYLNGLHVPASDVNVSFGVWNIPSATFTLPSHPLLNRLGAEDRLEVQIFYLDTFHTPDNPKYCILFDGEILGWSYSSSANSRDVQFSAVLDIQMWTQLFYFFMNNVDTVAEATFSSQDGVSEAGALYPTSLFMFGPFKDNQGDKSTIKRPFDILQNVMRGMLASDQPAHRRSVPAINFFGRWARKRNFLNKMVALPYLEDIVEGADPMVFPLLQAVQQQSVADAMRASLASSVGNSGSIFDVLKNLFGPMYYELGMLPTAPCFRVRLSDSKIIGDGDSSTVDRVKSPLRLMNYYAKPQTIFGIAPMCNVFFPSMVEAVQGSESYERQPTRVYVNDEFVAGKLATANNAPGATMATLTVAWPPQAQAAHMAKLQGKDASGGGKTGTGKNVLVYPEELFVGPIIDRMRLPPWFALIKKANAPTDKGSSPDLSYIERQQTFYTLYAQYEYHRTRLEKRTGSANVTFQPYAVPGFPCVVFDRQSSGFDVTGYLMSVSHQFSVRNGGRKSTSLQYSFVRTLPEMLEIVYGEARRLNAVLGSGPVDPVDALRDTFQDFGSAERFYSQFFHAGTNVNHAASFDFRELLAFEASSADPARYASGEKDLEDIVLTGDPVTGMKVLGDSAPKTTPLQTNIAEHRGEPLLPRAQYMGLFESHDAAMEAIARPICTLQQFVKFMHGEAALEDLVDAGQVVLSGSNDEGRVQDLEDLQYYRRIFRRRPLTESTPTPTIDNLGASAPDAPSSIAGGSSTFSDTGFKPLPADWPETRRDWDAILEQYCDEMARQAPQG